jgi:hypothetical protein
VEHTISIRGDALIESMIERLKKQYSYDSLTGIFTWNYHPAHSKINKGDPAGWEQRDSYGYKRWYILFDGLKISAHRLAWFYMHGVFPTNEIDHINGNPLDNRIVNLRDVLHRENQQNRKEHRLGRLVGANKVRGKWRARAAIGGKMVHLGYFPSEQEAHDAYIKALEAIV